jgi:glycine cleavage system H protein
LFTLFRKDIFNMADWLVPDNARFAESDEWVIVSGSTAKIGLSDYAQGQLSDIVFVDLSESEVGGKVTKGEPIAAVESVKAASDIYAPVSGEIVAVNNALDDAPEAINDDPYGAGWLIEIKLSNPAELDGLMDAAAYTKYCAEREE